MSGAIKCRVCGSKVPTGWKVCPVCRTPVETKQTTLEKSRAREGWKTLVWLGAFSDAEGSFGTYAAHDPRRGVYYPFGRFSIAHEAKPKWKRIVSYWKTIYGGTTYEYTSLLETKMYRWSFSSARELIPLLDDIIPHLYIKKADAERVRRFLIHYVPYRDKARKTKMEALELAEELSK